MSVVSSNHGGYKGGSHDICHYIRDCVYQVILDFAGSAWDIAIAKWQINMLSFSAKKSSISK